MADAEELKDNVASEVHVKRLQGKEMEMKTWENNSYFQVLTVH